MVPSASALQSTFFAQLGHRLSADSRIRAAWLEGSFGHGDADRYSDIDLHLLVDPSAADHFRANAENWLSSIQPLVLFKWMFGTSMINALTVDGLRIDIWLHEGQEIERDAARVQLLSARPDAFRFVDTPAEDKPESIAPMLDERISEFWRCIVLLPSVLGRNELIVTQMGLAIELRLLTDILIDGYNVERDAGVKKLNRFLPGDTQQAIEQALSIDGLSARTAALSHLRLAAIMQQHGPSIAAHHGISYPSELEDAVIVHVASELEQLALADCLAEAGIVSSPSIR